MDARTTKARARTQERVAVLLLAAILAASAIVLGSRVRLLHLAREAGAAIERSLAGPFHDAERQRAFDIDTTPVRTPNEAAMKRHDAGECAAAPEVDASLRVEIASGWRAIGLAETSVSILEPLLEKLEHKGPHD
jgi:hypothetical protein